MTEILNNQKIFITGGTGTIGMALVAHLTEQFPKNVIAVFSRDEHKQLLMERAFPSVNCVLGDVRDFERVRECVSGQGVVIHLAALKQLPRGESNGGEFTKTNILGSENVIRAACEKGVKHLLFLSSDKAVSPTSHYGSTKLSGEKYLLQQSIKYPDMRMSIVRSGNVWGSRGSISELLTAGSITTPLSITDLSNTRFSISAAKLAKSIVYALQYGIHGEVFVPKMKTYQLEGLLRAADVRDYQIVGLRSGERQHEVLFTRRESESVLTSGDHLIVPNPEFNPGYFQVESGLTLQLREEQDLKSSEEAKRIGTFELQQLLQPYEKVRNHGG